MITCLKCGRPLSSTKSVSLGIGPVCRKARKRTSFKGPRFAELSSRSGGEVKIDYSSSREI